MRHEMTLEPKSGSGADGGGNLSCPPGCRIDLPLTPRGVIAVDKKDNRPIVGDLRARLSFGLDGCTDSGFCFVAHVVHFSTSEACGVCA